MPMIDIKVALNIFILQISNIITQIYVVINIKMSINTTPEIARE